MGRYPGLAVLILFVSLNASAFKSGTINDPINFFSQDAVKKASELVKDLKKTHKKEVVVETIHKIPMTNEATVLDGKTQDPLFSEWAKGKLAKAGDKNIYIAISKNPSFVMASIGSQTRQKGEFTENDRNILIKILADNFQRRNNDRALLDSIQFVKMAIEANLRGTPIMLQQPNVQPKSDPNADVAFLWRWMGFGCAALLGLLLITGLIKGMGKNVKTAAQTLAQATKPPEQTPA